jgi:ribose transport system substrate-binding protein
MKTRDRKWWFLLIMSVASFILIFIFMNGEDSRVRRMIFIPKIIDEHNDFWVSVIDGANIGAKECGVDLKVEAGPSEEDWQSQNNLIEEAIAEKPDALIVAPCSYSQSTEILKKVKEAGICLTLIDSVIDEDIQDLTVSTDNIEAGRQLGKFAAGFLTKESKIAIMAHVRGTSTAMEREEGVREGLGEKETCIQEVMYSDSSEEKAYELTRELIFKYADLDMIIALNQPSSVGVGNAIRDLNFVPKVKAVGFDSSLNEIRLMENGIFNGIVIQKSYNMGYLGVQQTWMYLTGKSVSRKLNSGSKLITTENLYSDENQKLLFPFSEKLY